MTRGVAPLGRLTPHYRKVNKVKSPDTPLKRTFLRYRPDSVSHLFPTAFKFLRQNYALGSTLPLSSDWPRGWRRGGPLPFYAGGRSYPFRLVSRSPPRHRVRAGKESFGHSHFDTLSGPRRQDPFLPGRDRDTNSRDQPCLPSRARGSGTDPRGRERLLGPPVTLGVDTHQFTPRTRP